MGLLLRLAPNCIFNLSDVIDFMDLPRLQEVRLSFTARLSHVRSAETRNWTNRKAERGTETVDSAAVSNPHQTRLMLKVNLQHWRWFKCVLWIFRPSEMKVWWKWNSAVTVDLLSVCDIKHLLSMRAATIVWLFSAQQAVNCSNEAFWLWFGFTYAYYIMTPHRSLYLLRFPLLLSTGHSLV